MVSKHPPEGTQDTDSKDGSEEAQLQTVGAEPAAATSQGPAAKPPLNLAELKVEKSCSRGLAGWLSGNRISLAITSYQTGRVYSVFRSRVLFGLRTADDPCR